MSHTANLVITILILCLPLCNACNKRPNKSKQTSENEIRGTVIRQVISGYNAETQPEGPYYLSFGDVLEDKDPPEEFFRYVNDLVSEVQKFSDCYMDDYGIPKDKQTGKEGVILRVSDVEWVTEEQVKVSVHIHSWSWGQEGYAYTLNLENKTWAIKESQLTFIT